MGTGKYWKNSMVQRRYDMIRRCYDPNHVHYKDYGGRGITVCDRWLDPERGLENFIVDLGFLKRSEHVDRTDNDGPYSPDNVRPSTRKENMRNRRGAVFVTHNGVTRQACEWDEINGWKCGLTARRISRGWSPERAVTSHPTPSPNPRGRAAKSND